MTTATPEAAGKYISAVGSGLGRRNGWTLAEYAGDRSPGRTQRLLNRASWNTFAAMGVVSRFPVAGLEEAARRSRRRGLVIGTLDETGQEKAGSSTAGVQRQYLGCAGKVANGINTVHLAYVHEHAGHALIGARAVDPRRADRRPGPLPAHGPAPGPAVSHQRPAGRRVGCQAPADGIKFDFFCGDEVYGSCTQLREFFEDRGQAYVLRVPSSLRLTLQGGKRLACAQAARALSARKHPEVRSAGKGSKGQRWYA